MNREEQATLFRGTRSLRGRTHRHRRWLGPRAGNGSHLRWDRCFGWRGGHLSEAKQFLPNAMLVFSGGCGIETLANGFKLRGIWEVHNVWPFVSGQVEQHLVRIASL